MMRTQKKSAESWFGALGGKISKFFSFPMTPSTKYANQVYGTVHQQSIIVEACLAGLCVRHRTIIYGTKKNTPAAQRSNIRY